MQLICIDHNVAYVNGLMTLNLTREARQISIPPSTLHMLRESHGKELDDFWRREFGHGINYVTDVEAGYLCRVESVAAVKSRLAQAAEFARGRGFLPVIIDRSA